MPSQRQHGAEQAYWPAGPFKVRLPLIHYCWEFPEMIQGFVMFVVGLAMIPLLETDLGMPYEAALAFTFVAGMGSRALWLRHWLCRIQNPLSMRFVFASHDIS